jgi:hypothetical protein
MRNLLFSGLGCGAAIANVLGKHVIADGISSKFERDYKNNTVS